MSGFDLKGVTGYVMRMSSRFVDRMSTSRAQNDVDRVLSSSPQLACSFSIEGSRQSRSLDTRR